MLDVTDVFYLLILQFQATTHASKMSVLQCPNQLFNQLFSMQGSNSCTGKSSHYSPLHS